MIVGEARIRGARLIVAATAAVVPVVILLLARNFNFYFDEWDFILKAPDWSWLSFLQPHNEHPVVIPKLIYAALLSIPEEVIEGETERKQALDLVG